MPEQDRWNLSSFEGNRRAQHVAFMALSFREKVVRLEQMADVQRAFARATPQRNGPKQPSEGSERSR